MLGVKCHIGNMTKTKLGWNAERTNEAKPITTLRVASGGLKIGYAEDSICELHWMLFGITGSTSLLHTSYWPSCGVSPMLTALIK